MAFNLEKMSALVDNIEITDSYFTDLENEDSVEYSILVPVSIMSEKFVDLKEVNNFPQGLRSMCILPNNHTAIVSESRIENILVRIWFRESWQGIATKNRVIESLRDINKDIDKMGEATIELIKSLVEAKINTFFEEVEQGLLYYDRRK